MALNLVQKNDGRVILLRPDSTLTAEDYAELDPHLQAAVNVHGSVDLLVDMRGFSGISPGGLWKDIELDVKHHDDVRRLAVIGASKWQEWMTRFTKPFTSAEVRYFDEGEAREAHEFVEA